MARKPGTRARDYSLEPSTNRFGPKAVEPWSPWQLMVEQRRNELSMPLREVAARAQIPAGTFFNWVRAKRGAPPRVTYSANLNRRLAAAIQVTPEALATAYNASAFRPVDPNANESSPRPAPPTTEAPPPTSGLQPLLATLKATGRTSITIADLESLINMLAGPSDDPPVKPLDPPATS